LQCRTFALEAFDHFERSTGDYRVLVAVAVSKNAIRCTAKSNVADNEPSYSEYDIRFLITPPETIGLLD